MRSEATRYCGGYTRWMNTLTTLDQVHRRVHIECALLNDDVTTCMVLDDTICRDCAKVRQAQRISTAINTTSPY